MNQSLFMKKYFLFLFQFLISKWCHRKKFTILKIVKIFFYRFVAEKSKKFLSVGIFLKLHSF